MVKEWKRTAYKDNRAVYDTYIGWDTEAKFVKISLIDKTEDESTKIQIRTINIRDSLSYNAIIIPIAPWFGDCVPKYVTKELTGMGSYNVLVNYQNINTGNVYEIAGVVQKSADPSTSRCLTTSTYNTYGEDGRPKWKQVALIIPTDETALKPVENGDSPDNVFTKINIRLAKIDNKADRALRSNQATNTVLTKFIRKSFMQRMRWLFFGK